MKYLLPLAMMGSLMVLERLFPFRKNPWIKAGLFGDLGWYIWLQPLILDYCWTRHVHSFKFSHAFPLVSSFPFPVQFLLFFLAADFASYWLHRFTHTNDFFWRFHELHHSSLEVGWSSGARSHWVDVVIGHTAIAGVFVLLGPRPEVFYAFAAVISVYGLYKHANIRLKSGRLQYVFISSEMHRQHHLRGAKYQRSNYGEMLAVWDWLFGTALFPDEKEYAGVPFGTTDGYPQDVFRQNLHVFRGLGRA